MLEKLLKIKNVLLVVFLLLLLILIFSLRPTYSKKDLSYGATFSLKHARDLGLDWQQVYLAAIDDLNIKKLRLVAYWDEVEKNKNEFNWDDLDWQLNQAAARDAQVILAVGGRLPRWPECHFPKWLDGMSKADREEKALNYIAQTIERYKDRKEIVAWQVENEPFLSNFGKCPELDKDFLDEEIALVKKLDSSRPIVVTDSGELSVWVLAARRADIFGTTMYRDTYSAFLKRYLHYPITPAFFKFKRNMAELFSEPKEWVVIELQGEPWGPKPYQELSQQERDRTMDLEKFKEIIEFARLTGFKEFYLWGVEWWYWEKERNYRPEFWEAAREIFVTNK